jgi:ribosome biogenesis protein BMS1
MRLTGQVRRDGTTRSLLNIDSVYKAVERPLRRFNTLKISKNLQASLPYASKPKAMTPQHRQTYRRKRAVVLEPEEKRKVALLQHIRALRKDQIARRKEKKDKQRTTYQKEMAKKELQKSEKDKEKRKEYMRVAARLDRSQTDVEDGRARKRRKT